ncbi:MULTISPECIES: glycerol dehydrogenase [Clostridiaceae]|uniref:Glycerol dehydrogenase n=1 Tax=Clostridium facile TaxID=2763035 RepID=A0ABR7ITA6_9CLOT|nr:MULTISPECIES: glycerol dehydrogenase [Clostridiaceae]MBC5788379.1 glycerol dehydrogenase [Clostridium facile]
MAKVLISPGKYIQGSGEMKKIGEYAAGYGKKALILISSGGKKRIGAEIEASFQNQDCTYQFDLFNGECSKNEINRLVAVMEQENCDFVIGIGGGKIFDTAKAVAYYKNTPVLICPTIASTDAPCSALSVIYTDEGVFEEYLFLPSNPNLVLMDTDIIVKSPVRLTVAGIGDALATYFEARACQRSDAATCAGGKATGAAMALAKLCFDTLMEEGVKAKIALEAGACTESVEKVIEANTLLSGLGFESGGLAGAHAIHNGFTVLEECHHMYHGEKVAFGTITQLILENIPMEELADIIDFCIEVGLPVTLKQLGVQEVTDEKIMAVATAACAENDTLHNMPFEVTPEKVKSAILAADAYGHYFLGE